MTIDTEAGYIYQEPSTTSYLAINICPFTIINDFLLLANARGC